MSGPWDVKVHGDRRRPTTAEQAVPWLIGLLMAVSGLLIVMLVAIFTTGPGFAFEPASPSPQLSASPTPEPTPTPGTPTPEPTDTPEPTPTLPPLDTLYQAASVGLQPIHLLEHDFATATAPITLLADDRGVAHYAWAANGIWGVALVNGNLYLVTPGEKKRDIEDGIDGVTISLDSTTIFALRVTRVGSNDRAELLAVDPESATTTSLTVYEYPHPLVSALSAVRDAQFTDDGAYDRVYAMSDGSIVSCVLAADTCYVFDPTTNSSHTAERRPQLWSPNGQLRVHVTSSSGVTTLTLLGLAGEERATVTITGLVSHLRWSALNNQVIFTLNLAAAAGGVIQDIYLWDIQDGVAPIRLSQNGASYGPSFRGVEEHWKP